MKNRSGLYSLSPAHAGWCSAGMRAGVSIARLACPATFAARRTSTMRTLLMMGGLLFALLAGCARHGSRTISIIPETTAQELWEAEHAGAAAAASLSGWKIFWNGPSREDGVDRQIALVQEALDRHSGGLVLSPDHSIALTTIVRRAISSGLPTVITATSIPIPAGANLVYILDDDRAAGRLAADRIGAILGGKGEIAVTGFNPSIASTMNRETAFEDEIKQRFINIRVASRAAGSFRLSETEQNAEEVLRANPGLSAFVANGITATRGCYIALKITRRIGSVRLLGFDQDLDLMYYLRRGEIDSIVAQNTYAMGYQAVRAVQALQAGRAFPHELHIAPILITRQNIDQPEIQKILTMDWRPLK
jgi:ribose transport system substrate-binding protein